MSKLSIQEEKELVSFIKDWLKTHGFTQKDLANELNIKSSRTSEIIPGLVGSEMCIRDSLINS